LAGDQTPLCLIRYPNTKHLQPLLRSIRTKRGLSHGSKIATFLLSRLLYKRAPQMAHLAQSVEIPQQNVPPLLAKGSFWQSFILFGLVLWLYAPVLARLAAQWWTDPNFSHGFFVPAFSLYVVWINRDRLLAIKRNPSVWGLAIVLFSLCTLILGVFGAELFLSRISLIFLIAGLIIFMHGWQMFRAVLFPLAVLFLMVPIPSIILNQITFPLQILASKLSAWLLPLLGVPVLREGNVINLPAMPLEVADACSGIRSLLSLTCLAVMYGYLLESRVSVRVVLALASIPIAVAANGLRIVGTGLLVQYWDPDKAEGFFHAFSGWLIFVVSLLMVFGLHQLIRWRMGAQKASA
jgi:exosortase